VLHRRKRGLSLRWILTLGLQLRPHLQRNLAQAGYNSAPPEGSTVLQPNLATSVPEIVYLLQHVCILPLLRLGLHCCLHLLHQRGDRAPQHEALLCVQDSAFRAVQTVACIAARQLGMS
jgi:hypothetical protein